MIGVTDNNHGHRKRWLDEQVVHQAKYFGIDLQCQATMPDHLDVAQRGDIAECSAEIALGFKSSTGLCATGGNIASCWTSWRREPSFFRNGF